MKLIIDIPEEEHEFLKDLKMVNIGRGNCKTIQQNVINAIKFGTPITDGDLISRNALKEALRQRQWYIDDIEEVMKIIDNAPAIGDTTND